MAQYANCGDNDNSQAEGHPLRTNSMQQNRTNRYYRNNAVRNPHYENIYESIDHFATVNAPAPADGPQNVHIARGPIHRINARTRNNIHLNGATYTQPRNGAYDIPRQTVRSNNHFATNRRSNLDTNTNRVRYANTNRPGRQRSFDDTESYGNNWRYENIYEQIHEEPMYRNNNSLNRGNNSNGMQGRFFHGIGRIERHLSSSCGNLEHLNLGGTYAILGHSHLGTMGHIRVDAVNGNNRLKETAGKSLNIFSCLGRENSQSMSNIYRDSNNHNTAMMGPTQQDRPSQNENTLKNTGAIPKVRNPPATQQNSVAPMHTTTLNRMSKASLHWLMMNKWLPLWYYGDGSECNVMDFNFMFSRNCEGCIQDSTRRRTVENELYSNGFNPTDNNWHFNNNNGDNSAFQFGDADHFRHHRVNAFANQPHLNDGDAEAFEENSLSRSFRVVRPTVDGENPFRRWELNSEHNSFRPAPIRRITDGTFPNNVQMHNRTIRAEINRAAPQQNAGPSTVDCVPTTSRSNGESSAESSRSYNQSDNNRDNGPGATCSSTESSSEADNKVFSPDLSARRYSENTEDDQYNNTSQSSTITDGEDSDENSFDSQTNSAIDSARKSD